MTKTMKELAKQFTDELFAGDDLTDFDTQTEKNDAYVTCMAFGNHLMEQPLSVRLTAEEKEKIREQYDEVRIFTENENPPEYYLGQKVVLNRIFGKELFERKEE